MGSDKCNRSREVPCVRHFSVRGLTCCAVDASPATVTAGIILTSERRRKQSQPHQDTMQKSFLQAPDVGFSSGDLRLERIPLLLEFPLQVCDLPLVSLGCLLFYTQGACLTHLFSTLG